MVTSVENSCNGSGGLLYWSPTTNAFKSFCVAGSEGGFQFAVDLHRSTNSSAQSDDDDDDKDHRSDVDDDKDHRSDGDDDRDHRSDAHDDYPSGGGNNNQFSAGDVWSTVHSNPDFAPYVNLRGSDQFMRWNVGADGATGIRVNSGNGKVYFGNFGDGSEPPEIIELDPTTNNVRKWQTGNKPYQLFFDGTFVWATAVSSGTLPDQILRLDPSANWGFNLTRWDLPLTPSFQQMVVRGTNPNGITMDLEGNVWFTESAAHKVGRLDPTANTITEYTKGSVLDPQNISSSGTQAILQVFFTEGTGNAVSVLTPGGSAGVPFRVYPTFSRVDPSTSMAQPMAFTLTASETTITPATCQVEGADPSDIFRFPAPFLNSEPSGITRVVAPYSVFGTLHNSSHVFQLSTSAIIAPPSSACREDDDDVDHDVDHDDAKHTGLKSRAKMHHKECEDSGKDRHDHDKHSRPPRPHKGHHVRK
jgi:streptogramin lyase